MKLEPGEIVKGLTEYIFICYKDKCGYREVIHALTKKQAIRIACEGGWFTRNGKWYCSAHRKVT